MSTLKVNKIIPTSGVPTGGGGGIVQVRQAVMTGTFSQSSLAVNTNTIIVLSQAITPLSSSNKIKVTVNMTVGCSSDNGIFAKLFRDSTQICLGDSAGNRQRISSHGPTRNGDNLGNLSIVFLDSPNSTSSITYGVKISHGASSAKNVYVNRTDSDQDQTQIGRGVSTITLEEVSA
tara:strand:+ start:784 stop:1311 length:528 start_codon:yes stop_codon:yes gene_type:complete